MAPAIRSPPKKRKTKPTPLLIRNSYQNVTDMNSSSILDPHTYEHSPFNDLVKRKCCPLCTRAFSVFRARHACRLCHEKVCDECSKTKVCHINARKRRQRVCDVCAQKYNETLAREEDDHEDAEEEEEEGSELESLNDSIYVRNAKNTALPNPKSECSLSYTHWHVLTLFYTSCAFIRLMWGSGELNQLSLLHWSLGPLKLINALVTTSGFGLFISFSILLDELVSYLDQHELVLGKTQRESKRPSTALASEEIMTPGTPDLEEEMTESAVPLPLRGDDDEEDSIEVDTGENQKNEDKFSLFTLMDLLNKFQESPERIPAIHYIETCKEIAKMMGCLSPATSFVAGTVRGYLQTIEETLPTWPRKDTEGQKTSLKRSRSTPPTPESTHHVDNVQEYAISDIIQREVEWGIATRGGKRHPSMSRCILRLLWLVEFVEAWLRLCYLESQEDDISAAAGLAYEQTLGKNHSWLIRQGVVGMLSNVGKRSTFLLSLGICNGDDREPSIEAALVATEQAQKLLQLMHTQVWAIFQQHHIEQIK